ncbi:hypothetical protein NDU88_001636, partial [Pleurodeles waltl]
RVSQPLLTMGADGGRAAVGDTVLIQCTSQRGSAPIKYQFYHQENVLETVTVNHTGPGTYRMIIASLEDAGDYYCDADNGIYNGIQRSDPVTLSVI